VKRIGGYVRQVRDAKPDTQRGRDPATMTVDGVHPNATGEPLIAQNMADALARLGYLSAPEVFRGPVTWAPRPVPAAVGRRGAVDIAWGALQVQRLRMWEVQLAWRRIGESWRESGPVDARRHLAGTVSGLRPGI